VKIFKEQELGIYMRNAYSFSELSKAIRTKVGAVLVTNNGVVLPGVNGTPSGTDNCCENTTRLGLVTKPEVIHAELNCILKAAKEGVCVLNSTLFVTLSPCLSCAAMLKQAGVTKVYYSEQYRVLDGVDYLRNNQVHVEQLILKGKI
jgi:dCMP deaminase